ncbi:hypothetical protein ACO2Q7_05600 [Rathayibacter sp. KR2-224]|uniref:hypothetical protein n=1 Tax=Rathayibacter sp. KR2-224 TaxID=3400913 RepID=UPI003C01CB1D
MEYIVFAAGAVIMGLFCVWTLFDSAKDAATRQAHPERSAIVDTEHHEAIERAH